MFPKVSQLEWENLVKKQLKTDDIYSVLQKNNLENIDVKPYYSELKVELPTLPRYEESTQLVANYDESLEQDVYAFIVDENYAHLTEKSLFFKKVDFLKSENLVSSNSYFSLVDVFQDAGNLGSIDLELTNILLSKSLSRNICVDVSFHQNCGASIIQQLAIALAKTKDLVEEFGKDILGKIIFRFALGSNYFFEISKIRAFKLLFIELCKEYDVEEIPYIFAESSLRNKAKHDPENNLIRSTLELSSAMLGGADAVFSNDYLINDGNALSEEISFKQQIVLAYESLINVFEDAANGSFYVENITQQIAEKSWQLFLEIEQKGGYCSMLKSGDLTKMIYNQAVSEQKWVENGDIKLVGVNLYPKLEQTKSIDDLYSQDQLNSVRWAEMFE